MVNVNLWSTTPADNATADPDIPMGEGMAPGLVNDGIREVMAGVAEIYADLGTASAEDLNAMPAMTMTGAITLPNNVAIQTKTTGGVASNSLFRATNDQLAISNPTPIRAVVNNALKLLIGDTGGNVTQVDLVPNADGTLKLGTSSLKYSEVNAVDGNFSDDVTVGDDLSVGGDAAVTGALTVGGVSVSAINNKTSVTETAYPIGAMLLVRGSTIVDRNDTRTVYYNASATGAFSLSPDGGNVAIDGTWRACGAFPNGNSPTDIVTLFQRVA